MAQNIIYRPWEGTEGPWPCLMAALLLFSLLWLFPFVSAFLISLIKLTFWLKLSTDKRQAEDVVGGREDKRVLLCFKHRHTFKERLKQVNELSDHKPCLFTKNTAARSSGTRHGLSGDVSLMSWDPVCRHVSRPCILWIRTCKNGHVWVLPNI